MAWEPEDLETLRRLAAEGLNARAIGAEMGRSRNAIIGAAHRNKVALKRVIPEAERVQRFGTPGSLRPGKGNRRAKRPASGFNAWPGDRPGGSQERKPARLPKMADPVVEPRRVHFSKLGPRQCRYALWGHEDAPSMLFCGHEVKSGAWCPAHRALVYQG